MHTIKLTPSQKQAIGMMKRTQTTIHSQDVEFKIYIPHNTNIVRLVAVYKIKNVLGDNIIHSVSWTIGKKGKISNE